MKPMIATYCTLLSWFAGIAYAVILAFDTPSRLVKRPAYPAPFCSGLQFGKPQWADCNAALALLPTNDLGTSRTFVTTLDASPSEAIVRVPYQKQSGTCPCIIRIATVDDTDSETENWGTVRAAATSILRSCLISPFHSVNGETVGGTMSIGTNLRMNVTISMAKDASSDNNAVEIPAVRSRACEWDQQWDAAAAAFSAAVDRATCNAKANGKYWTISAIHPGRKCFPIYCAEPQGCCSKQECGKSALDVARAVLVFGVEFLLSGLQYGLCD
ncbi:MAG: hypothetical protein M1812_003228 [Candelaria pacifica]|nr:MAG: hypothetical protein M1812_003228 [Candelaria pacifica]